MLHDMVNINKRVSMGVFEKPEIQNKINFLFKRFNEEIKKRYEEIKNSSKQSEIRNIKYRKLKESFKYFFLRKALNEAIEKMFSDTKYDRLSRVIIYSLTEDSLKESIYGLEMVEAFEEIITTFPAPATYIRGYEIVSIREKFLKDNPYSRKLKKANWCDECSCECRCNGDCEGDTKKCSSIKAKNIGCNHHCDCWIVPLAEKRRKEREDESIATGCNLNKNTNKEDVCNE